MKIKFLRLLTICCVGLCLARGDPSMLMCEEGRDRHCWFSDGGRLVPISGNASIFAGCWIMVWLTSPPRHAMITGGRSKRPLPRWGAATIGCPN